jgi:hypothetical protein
VIRPALARLNASIMISSSMIDWLTGWQVGWTRKTSFSRTLSRMRTKMFSFANWKTSALPGSTPRYWQILRLRSGFEFPW